MTTHSLTPSQELVLQDMSQLVENCPNLYGISTNRYSYNVVKKLISKAREFLYDQEEDERNTKELANIGQAIKEIYEATKNINDDFAKVFVFVLKSQFNDNDIPKYFVYVLKQDDYLEWLGECEEGEDESFDAYKQYCLTEAIYSEEQRLTKFKIYQ